LSVTPGADGSYPPYMVSGKLWRGGETLMVSAAGGVVPAFSQGVNAPAALTVIAPASGTLSIDPSHDYNVTWGTPISDDVEVDLTMDAGDSLSCRFSGGDLMGVLPSLALSLVHSGSGSWSIGATNVKTFTAGDFVVTVAAVQDGSDTAGKPASGLLVLQ
jgi:hypothetical protein